MDTLLQTKLATAAKECRSVLPDIARGLWKQAQNKRLLRKSFKKRRIITLYTHTKITLNPEISLYLLLFLYVTILFCFSSRTSKQYDMKYNSKRNTLTTSPKTCNLWLPIFISPKSLIIRGLGNCAVDGNKARMPHDTNAVKLLAGRSWNTAQP